MEIQDFGDLLTGVTVPEMTAFEGGGDEFKGKGGFANVGCPYQEGKATWNKPWVDKIIRDLQGFGVGD